MAQSVTPHLPLGMEEGEELCRGKGFEYVEAEAKGRNEYGGRSSLVFSILPGSSEMRTCTGYGAGVSWREAEHA